MAQEGGAVKKAGVLPRRVVAGADPFGSELKATLVEYLKEKNIEVVDLGVDKYYSVAVKVASELAKEKKVGLSEEPLSRGLLVCGTGVGVSIFANKFAGVYAAPCNSVDEAVNARSINNTNVLTLGAKIASSEEGKKILDAWLETSFKAPCPASDGCPWNDEIQQFLDASVEEMERISQAALENGGVLAAVDEEAVHDKSTSTTDIGVLEKTSDAGQSPVDLLQNLLESSTLSADPFLDDNRPILGCEERAGVGIGLNPVYATASIAGWGAKESKERAGVGPGLMAIKAPISQLSTVTTADFTDFELPTAAPTVEEEETQGNAEEGKEDLVEAKEIEKPSTTKQPCAICALASAREFEDVDIMPGGSWRIVREDPTSAVVRFKAGSVEPAHHHTFGHDLIVNYGKKTVWNLSTKENFNLTKGDFLYTPAGDVHRVQYHEDTEFFIRWDGHWDILLDEDIDTAKAALRSGSNDS